MQRGGKVVLVAHCLLDVNTKVHGLATYTGVHPIVREWLAGDVGLIQLPCPEVVYLGMARWGMTREQYDVPSYRSSCRRLAEPVAETVAALATDGCELLGLWGVDGSPSCGVARTCAGYLGGEIERLTCVPRCESIPGEGVFVTVLRSCLADHGVSMPFHAVDEEA